MSHYVGVMTYKTNIMKYVSMQMMHTIRQAREDLPELIGHTLQSIVLKKINMNGRLDKVAMTNKLMQLKENYTTSVR